MASLDDDVRHWTDQLRHASASQRQQAASRLAGLGHLAVSAVPALADALADQAVEVRKAVASALAEMGPDARPAVPALVRSLSDDDEAVRRRSALALGEIGPEARPAVPALVRAMQSDPGLAVRRFAAAALGEIGPGAAAALGPLVECLADADGRLRAIAGAALLRLCPRAVPRLIDALRHPSPRARACAARLVSRAGAVVEAGPVLGELLADPDEDVRLAARAALGAN
jgi:HEAT repeat protein